MRYFEKITPLMLLSLLYLNCDEKIIIEDKDIEISTNENWELVWSDDFDQNNIDDQKWTKLRWRPGWVNNEDQAYTNRDTNIFTRDGKLVIRALIEPGYVDTDYTGSEYNADFTSGRLNTSGKHSWVYGKFEIRAKLPNGKGSWPAIWMLGDNISTDGWPHCGEIDIMEHVGYEEGNIHGSIHTTDYNHMNGTQKSGNIEISTVADSFHLYSLEWDSTYLRFSVDNQPYFFIYNDSNGDQDKWPFNLNHYLILNLAIGGDWGGVQGINQNAFPMEMEVDYVRVYKKTDVGRSLTVKFQVDMRNQIVSGTGVWLSGGNLSNGSPGGIQMYPISESTIWERTLILPKNSDFSYKFRNGLFPDSWSGGWEIINGECGFGEFSNRNISTSSQDTVLSIVCFGECDLCE
ncbi:MAG: hypothetical protein CMG23_02855 [Candidatus Marinimicrobia bacterium]|nr:hypothetical protein [Candidatus Neomarinimicrobiota bacterium]